MCSTQKWSIWLTPPPTHNRPPHRTTICQVKMPGSIPSNQAKNNTTPLSGVGRAFFVYSAEIMKCKTWHLPMTQGVNNGNFHLHHVDLREMNGQLKNVRSLNGNDDNEKTKKLRRSIEREKQAHLFRLNELLVNTITDWIFLEWMWRFLRGNGIPRKVQWQHSASNSICLLFTDCLFVSFRWYASKAFQSCATDRSTKYT